MNRYEFWLTVLIGIALALPYAWLAHGRKRVFAAGLVIAAAIYIGFAAFGGSARDVLIESGGAILFAIVAFLGMRRPALLLALGWTAHAGWDLLLHPASAPSYAPSWYPAACLGFDLVVASFILRNSLQRGKLGP